MSAYTIVSKLLTPLLQPGNFLLLLVLIGLISSRRWHGGRILAWLGVLCLLAMAIFPAGGIAVTTLEDRFPQPVLPTKVDGIIVLGGSVQTGTSASRGQPTLNDNAERDIAFVALARRYPDARLVMSGGTGKLIGDGTTEAAIARDVYVSLGVDPARLILEDHSRNTWENAEFSRNLVKPIVGETWLLVTSARHMPRAVGVFRQIGWPVMPYPVDYRTSGRLGVDIGFDLGVGLRGANEAFHEWGGLLVYYALGRTNQLFPGP